MASIQVHGLYRCMAYADPWPLQVHGLYMLNNGARKDRTASQSHHSRPSDMSLKGTMARLGS